MIVCAQKLRYQSRGIRLADNRLIGHLSTVAEREGLAGTGQRLRCPLAAATLTFLLQNGVALRSESTLVRER